MKKKFSYSSNELSKPKQFIINSIEKISGRKKLEKLYQQYNEEDSKPHLFWTDVKNLLKLKVDVKSKIKLNIPKKGPLIIIANHPFGIIDGIIIASLVSEIRSDFKIITHEVLRLSLIHI